MTKRTSLVQRSELEELLRESSKQLWVFLIFEKLYRLIILEKSGRSFGLRTQFTSISSFVLENWGLWIGNVDFRSKRGTTLQKKYRSCSGFSLLMENDCCIIIVYGAWSENVGFNGVGTECLAEPSLNRMPKVWFSTAYDSLSTDLEQ